MKRSIEQFVKEYKADENRVLRSLTGKLKDKESDNIFNEVTITDSEFRSLIIELLLGKEWYISSPLGLGQINSIAFMEIMDKYGNTNKRKESIIKRILKKHHG